MRSGGTKGDKRGWWVDNGASGSPSSTSGEDPSDPELHTLNNEIRVQKAIVNQIGEISELITSAKLYLLCCSRGYTQIPS